MLIYTIPQYDISQEPYQYCLVARAFQSCCLLQDYADAMLSQHSQMPGNACTCRRIEPQLYGEDHSGIRLSIVSSAALARYISWH